MSANFTSSLSTQRVRLMVWVLLSFFPLVGMGVDLLAPSLPAISSSLHISSVISKNLIAIYLLAYAIGNFCSGVSSDALGRKPLLISGFFIFVIASILPIAFANAIMLLIARFLQGFTIATYTVASRAVLSDVLDQEKLMKVAPMVAMMWGIGPIIGPVIGGYLQFYFGWQADFYFFALYGLLGLILILVIVPETHSNRQPLNFLQFKANMTMIITHRLFIGMATIMGIFYSLLIVFNTLGPFLIQVEIGRTSIYFGHIAMLMGAAFFIGAMICRRLLTIYQPEKMLSIGIPVFLLIAIIGLGFAYAASKNIWIVAIFSFLMFLGSGMLYPGAMGRCLALFRHLAGNGIAVMNLINVFITGLVALVMSFIVAGSMISLAWIYLVLMIFSGVVYWYFIKPVVQHDRT